MASCELRSSSVTRFHWPPARNRRRSRARLINRWRIARAARVVELRYFAGLCLELVAATLGLTRRTIDRVWRFARAFIKAHLE
jgi:hypothetical protein